MTVPNFNKAIAPLTKAEQQLWREKVIICSFCHYDRKGKTFRKFINSFMKSERQKLRDYTSDHTWLGENRYQPVDSYVLLKMFALVEYRSSGSARRHLCTCLQLVFKFNPEVTIDTQCNQFITLAR